MIKIIHGYSLLGIPIGLLGLFLRTLFGKAYFLPPEGRYAPPAITPELSFEANEKISEAKKSDSQN